MQYVEVVSTGTDLSGVWIGIAIVAAVILAALWFLLVQPRISSRQALSHEQQALRRAAPAGDNSGDTYVNESAVRNQMSRSAGPLSNN